MYAPTHARSLLGLGICISICMSGAVTADPLNWNQFRGPNASGVADESANPPLTFGPEENLLWKSSVTDAPSSPCLWGDKIFLTGFDRASKSYIVLALSAQNGEILWRNMVEAGALEPAHGANSPASATPVTDGQGLYVYFGSRGLLCYALDGSLKWDQPFPVLDEMLPMGTGTSPILSGDRVFLARDAQSGGNLLALEKTSGNVVWESAMPENKGLKSYATPVVGGDLVIIHGQQNVSAYRIENGEQAWTLPVPSNGTSTPVLGDGIVYVGAWSNFGAPELNPELPDFDTMLSKYGKAGADAILRGDLPSDLLLAERPEDFESSLPLRYVLGWFDENRDNSLQREEWGNAVDFVMENRRFEHGIMAIPIDDQGSLSTPPVAWQVVEDTPEVPSPLYYRDRIWMIKNGGIVTCMDAKSGNVLYHERLGASGPYFSSPIAAAGRIYIASNKGTVTVLAASDKFEILAQNSFREKISATPAIVGDTLYLRTDAHLYAFRN